MITLNLEWREVLWWLDGGMAGSNLRWSVYEDMVNRVWPQCTEQERRNMWLIMRRDLGNLWRPGNWNGHGMETAKGEGPWKPLMPDGGPADGHYHDYIMPGDEKPWKDFRHVLARFDPDNQYAVRLTVKSEAALFVCMSVYGMSKDNIIDAPTRYTSADGSSEAFDIKGHPYITIRTYGWKNAGGEDSYFIDFHHYVDPDRIEKVEKINIPDDGTM